MKHLKTFESWGMTSKEEMMDYLCRCGYEMSELEEMGEDELKMMCNDSEPMEESWGMGKEEMMEYLCRCGYPLRDLMSMEEEELHSMCMETGKQGMMEEKKWIQDTKMKKGALHKQLGYGDDETIPAGVIKKIVDGEVGSKVKVKGEEHTITALMKKRANLAKTLKKLK
jgi:CDGSH-type Zn-finger protein